MTLLDTINSREALCALNDVQLRQLCDEIRQFLVLNVARTGGHLASNLGVVELSVALERVFDTSRDRLLFDVGHQSYVHKILTGRRDEFRTLRMFGGLAGFPKPSESVTDRLWPVTPPAPSPPPSAWRVPARCSMRTITSWP